MRVPGYQRVVLHGHRSSTETTTFYENPEQAVADEDPDIFMPMDKDGVPLHQSQDDYKVVGNSPELFPTPDQPQPSTSQAVEVIPESNKVIQLMAHPQAPGAFSVNRKKIPGADLIIVERGNS